MDEPKKWTRVSRKELLSHPRIHLVEDEVALPDGNTIPYLRELSDGIDSVSVIAIDEEGQILLQREYSYPPDEVMWQLPGGGMAPGESVEAAALRELSEESNYTAATTEVLGAYYISNRRTDRKQHVVVCTDLSPLDTPGDPEEFIVSQWKSPEEVLELVRNGGIVNINMLASLLLLQARDSS